MIGQCLAFFSLLILLYSAIPSHAANSTTQPFQAPATPGKAAPAQLPVLTPLAQQWLLVLNTYNRSAIFAYDQVAREHIDLYGQRAAANAAIGRSMSLLDDRLPALATELWYLECRMWQSVRIHLRAVEERVYPPLTLYSRGIEELLAPEVRHDPHYRAIIADLDDVVAVATRKYADDAAVYRNWGLRETRRLMNAMLQLHRMALAVQEQATTTARLKEADVELQRLQTAYERIYDRASNVMEQAVKRYWIGLRHTIDNDVIKVNLECSLKLLATLK